MKSEIISIRPDARVKSNGCHGTLEREEWRAVKGYEGYYEVSSFGRVRSLDRVEKFKDTTRPRKGKVMTLQYTFDGYPAIGLRKDGGYKRLRVHRLVADAFIPNPDNLPCVNHRNEDKTCNIPDNLEYCSIAYNNSFGNRLALCSATMKGRKHSEEFKQKLKEGKRHKMKAVLQYTNDGEFVAEYESQREAQRATGIHNGHIGGCCRGERNHAGGYVWRYKE